MVTYALFRYYKNVSMLFYGFIPKELCFLYFVPSSHGSDGQGYKDKRNMTGASLVAQIVKNLPAVRETWVPSLGWENPLEEGMATHSSTLA